MSPLEIAGSTLGFIQILLLIRRSVWNFPVAMAMVTCIGIVLAEARLYAEAGLQVFFFVVNAWAGDAPDRRGLVPVAMRRFAERTGAPVAGERVVIIGDTPADIDCAHASGARCLAVATGHFSADTLRAAGADLVADDLRDTERLLAWIEKSVPG